MNDNNIILEKNIIKLNEGLYINKNYIISIVNEPRGWKVYMRNDISYSLTEEAESLLKIL